MKTPNQIEMRKAAELEPYARNSRTHSDDQVDQIAASIREFGMVGAIVVRNGVIAKGHGTLQAKNNPLNQAAKLLKDLAFRRAK